MKAMLIPIDGGEPFEIRRDLVLVGRQANCDFQIEDKTISKLHCILAKTDGLIVLRDLGSTNGVMVNDQKVMRAALLPNDVLSIASFKFKVHLGSDDPRRSANPGVTEVIETTDSPLLPAAAPAVAKPARPRSAELPVQPE